MQQTSGIDSQIISGAVGRNLIFNAYSTNTYSGHLHKPFGPHPYWSTCGYPVYSERNTRAQSTGGLPHVAKHAQHSTFEPVILVFSCVPSAEVRV